MVPFPFFLKLVKLKKFKNKSKVHLPQFPIFNTYLVVDAYTGKKIEGKLYGEYVQPINSWSLFELEVA